MIFFAAPTRAPIQFGPYLLTECVGQGGMAVVYKATRTGPGGFEKTVVIKALLPTLTARAEFVAMFSAEARLMAQLAHPNIVQVHDYGVVEDIPYLAMEYLPGWNLTQLQAAVADAGRRVPVGAALAIAREIGHGLRYAHEFVDAEGCKRQIIHRDVSPSNVMVCRDGAVKLLDFGVAKIVGEFDYEVTHSFKGKYAYMAPEQVIHAPIDRRVDVFAAGVILHELLTGKRLFAAASELETLRRVAAASVVAPSVDNRDVPAALDAIVKKALARNPSERYMSGADMAEALDALAGISWSGKRLAAWLDELFASDTELGAAARPAGPVDTERNIVRAQTVTAQSAEEPLPLPPLQLSHSKSGRTQLSVVRAPETLPPFAADATETEPPRPTALPGTDLSLYPKLFVVPESAAPATRGAQSAATDSEPTQQVPQSALATAPTPDTVVVRGAAPALEPLAEGDVTPPELPPRPAASRPTIDGIEPVTVPEWVAPTNPWPAPGASAPSAPFTFPAAVLRQSPASRRTTPTWELPRLPGRGRLAIALLLVAAALTAAIAWRVWWQPPPPLRPPSSLTPPSSLPSSLTPPPSLTQPSSPTQPSLTPPAPPVVAPAARDVVREPTAVGEPVAPAANGDADDTAARAAATSRSDVDIATAAALAAPAAAKPARRSSASTAAPAPREHSAATPDRTVNEGRLVDPFAADE